MGLQGSIPQASRRPRDRDWAPTPCTGWPAPRSPPDPPASWALEAEDQPRAAATSLITILSCPHKGMSRELFVATLNLS